MSYHVKMIVREEGFVKHCKNLTEKKQRNEIHKTRTEKPLESGSYESLFEGWGGKNNGAPDINDETWD